jgi:hypothetical protein
VEAYGRQKRNPLLPKVGCARELRLGMPKNIENNPMQSNMVSLAWML